jgi:hypothetical protein
MRRREFIAGLGSAAMWPLAARAQQSERVRRIGWLFPIAENDPLLQNRIAAFRDGLGKLGWIEGRNLRIDSRFAGVETNRVDEAAAELIVRGALQVWRSRSRPFPQIRCGIGRARTGRHPGPGRVDRWAAATSDSRRANRFRGCHRPGRQRLRREPSATGRERYWFQPFRIWPQREMAGPAQADRPASEASSGHP